MEERLLGVAVPGSKSGGSAASSATIRSQSSSASAGCGSASVTSPVCWREHVADERRLLARLRVLGPVAGDRRVELEQAALGEQPGARGGERLRDRVDVRDRVPPPRRAGDGVGETGPEVDREPAVEPDGDRGAELAALLEPGRERVADGVEPRVAATVELGLHAPTIALRAGGGANCRAPTTPVGHRLQDDGFLRLRGRLGLTDRACSAAAACPPEAAARHKRRGYAQWCSG